jgi:hypothetical protein
MVSVVSQQAPQYVYVLGSRAKYDDVDYHDSAALEAGQPYEAAFVHIGLYLAWLIKRDLHDPRWFLADLVHALKAGSIRPTGLLNEVDGKLTSDLMTPEAISFTDARYKDYLAAYDTLFADRPDYSVRDDDESVARVGDLLDRLYGEWVAGGWPAPEHEPEVIVAWGRPHEAPDLELKVPLDLGPGPLKMQSFAAVNWPSRRLIGALHRLAVDPMSASVASGSDPESRLSITLYRVPGASANDLSREFRSVVRGPAKARWAKRRLAGRDIFWSKASVAGSEVAGALWTEDGLVVCLVGERPAVDQAVEGWLEAKLRGRGR